MQKKEKERSEEKNTESREIWLDNSNIKEVAGDDIEKINEEEEQ
jgi:hypothetical protein